jgi:glycerate 2-kinase
VWGARLGGRSRRSCSLDEDAAGRFPEVRKLRLANLGIANMKKTAQHIFREVLAAIDIGPTIDRALARTGSRIQAGEAAIDLSRYREVVGIAFGKASFSMAEAVTRVLAPEYPVEGIFAGPAGPARQLAGWQTFVGGHPTPNAESFAAGRAILDRLARCHERSLIFFLVSGGGSSLVEQALDPALTLEDFRRLHSALVTCGASIEEINVVRKHVSATKGGRLAAAAPNAMKVTLAVSDVPRGQESALASGPTLPDPSTVRDAQRIAREYKLLEKFPPLLRDAFEKGALAETPKLKNPAFARAHFVRIVGEHELMHAAHHACEAEGYVCVCDNTTDNWPVEKAAEHLLALLESQKRENPGERVAVLADGELSSPVIGRGIGGRNSAFVLACVPKIAGKAITVLSAGTDGIDGNSSAAGAAADGETFSRAAEAEIVADDFFKRSDAYSFFARLGDQIVTGPTGNNLRDLRILLWD